MNRITSSLLTTLLVASTSWAWTPATQQTLRTSTALFMSGSLHGMNSCFLPLKQLDQDYYAPRIIQVRFAPFSLIQWLSRNSVFTFAMFLSH
jgi:hypothetical protein